jgi:hypothetical protein
VAAGYLVSKTAHLRELRLAKEAADKEAAALTPVSGPKERLLVGAENLGEAMELQAAHWRKQLDALTAQAEEVRELSIRVTSDAAEPLKEQATRGMAQ